MPEQTQGFVDKADSKYMNFLIGARASLCTCSRPSSAKRVARDSSVDEGLVACRRTSRNQQFTAFRWVEVRRPRQVNQAPLN